MMKKILHYALGFPPYRSGGLTKFCVDLMVQQAKEGHEVGMLWPGQMRFFNSKTFIKKHKNVQFCEQSIQNFEVINPLPVSLDEGIADIAPFVKEAKEEVYEKFIKEFAPDVIHVHTLMGLHRSFLSVAKKMNIFLVFSAHDFFPICPKVTIFRQGKNCGSVQNCEECAICNATALSINKIKILQSPIYRKIKDLRIIKKMRKQHRDTYLSESKEDVPIKSIKKNMDYKELRNYYFSFLKLMDIIHYNSSVTKEIYDSFFELPNSCTVSITHSDISDERGIKKYLHNKLRVRYLGPQGQAKGFFLLKEALEKLWSKRKEREVYLDVHFSLAEQSPYIISHGKYEYEELRKIFDETDVLVVPSLWYETFGFTVLEALSYGVPVVISGNVGAKDILVEGSGIVIEEISPEKLCSVLENLTPNELKKMNYSINENQPILQIDEMSKQIQKLCYGWNR